MNKQNKFIALKKASFSKFLQEDDLWYLLSVCETITLEPDQILFDEKSRNKSMFVILEGELEVYKQYRKIAKRGVGEYIGEMSLLEPQSRSASIKAVSDTVLLKIDEAIFNDYLGSNPKIIWDISKTLSERIRKDLDVLNSSYQDLKRSEEVMHRIVDSVSDLVFQIDPTGVIVFVNKNIRLLGYEEKDLIGKPFAEIYDGEIDDQRKLHIFSRRAGPRSLDEVEFTLKVDSNSNLYKLATNMSYLVSTLGLWNVPQEMVLEKGVEKEFLGSLLIARSQLLDIKI